MSMKEQGWVEEVQQAVEGLKAGMGQIPAVHHAKAWEWSARMSNPGSRAASGPASRARIHISRSVYWCPPAVPHGAAQPQDAYPLILVQAVLHTQAAGGWSFPILAVVIPVDIQDGAAGEGGQEGEIAGVQVAAGEDQVQSLQLAGGIEVPECPGFTVRNS